MNRRPILLFSFMQIIAVIYGVLAAGVGCKFGRIVLDFNSYSGPTPALFVMADRYRNYGFLLFLAVLLWTSLMSYFSSDFSPREISVKAISTSGLTLAVIYAALGTILALCAMFPLAGSLLIPK